MEASTQLAEREKEDQAIQSEKLDEAQILAELKGNIIEEYFYEFKTAGKLVAGVSFSGVKYCARLMAEQGHPLSIEDMPLIVKDGDSYFAQAAAKDLKTGEKRWGTIEQQTFDNGRPIPFAYTLASSKAQRNALRHFLPETVLKEAYLQWSKAGKKAPSKGPKDITAESKVSAPLPSKDEVRFALKDIGNADVKEVPGGIGVFPHQNVMLEPKLYDNLKELLGEKFEGVTWFDKSKGGPCFKVPAE